ncbi:MAG: hypothetical protein K2O16_20035 [Lachnospiraceae bacterium]|nr:hypothetical protein [Lachnospiraceae bacterium]
MAAMRRDNIMENMAREVNMLDHDNKSEAQKPISAKERKTGIIAFWCILALVVFIILLFVIV